MTSADTPQTLQDALRVAIQLDAPLDERLAVVRDAVERLSPVFAAGVQRMVDRLTAGCAGAGAPNVGDALPPFCLPDQDGRLTSLADVLADGPAVIAFHRGHWCPYCRLHARALGEVRRRVSVLGARMIAIAPNLAYYNGLLREAGGDEMPILSDLDNSYATALGLVIWVGDEMRALKLQGGYDLTAYHGNDDWLLPIPATFVVDRDGRIVARHMDPDYRRRVDIAALMQALEQLTGR
jgi:peroxiredoxin